MAKFVYIDETGSVGKGAKRQPELLLVAALVDEKQVQPLSSAFRAVVQKHLGPSAPATELHGHEIWGQTGPWAAKSCDEVIAAYEDALSVLDDLEIDVASASIHKQRLHEYGGGKWDNNAYMLALQFLLEKVDRFGADLKIVIADEAKEQQVNAISMVADLQTWGSGAVPGRQLTRIIDSMHFVNSASSPGVHSPT